MLLFCPTCSNSLIVSKSPETATNRLECRTCPYQFILTKRYYERRLIKRKEVEDVMGGAGSWDNVDNMEIQCPVDACLGTRAYFFQVQIRSADEPTTLFLKCMECGHRWKEG